MQKYKKYKNENRQKHVISEGFSQNELHHQTQRNFLRIVALVNIDFRHFFEDVFFGN